MIERPFSINRIEAAWREAAIVWLAGVRRSGKMILVGSLGGEGMYRVKCNLPVVADMVADPELFYRKSTRPNAVFDKIHQLQDPRPEYNPSIYPEEVR
jgi:hypothetical protein